MGIDEMRRQIQDQVDRAEVGVVFEDSARWGPPIAPKQIQIAMTEEDKVRSMAPKSIKFQQVQNQ